MSKIGVHSVIGPGIGYGEFLKRLRDSYLGYIDPLPFFVNPPGD